MPDLRPIPVELQQLGKLTILHLQDNQLSGQEALRVHISVPRRAP
jgi:hypothetical protein